MSGSRTSCKVEDFIFVLTSVSDNLGEFAFSSEGDIDDLRTFLSVFEDDNKFPLFFGFSDGCCFVVLSYFSGRKAVFSSAFELKSEDTTDPLRSSLVRILSSECR